MASKTFSPGVVIDSPWLNDVNDAVYDVLGDGVSIPATKAAARTNLGLGNVDNTSDANKPISTATQAAITATNAAVALKAPLASPALSGIPTAPTAATGTNTTQVATTAFVRTAMNGPAVYASNGGSIPTAASGFITMPYSTTGLNNGGAWNTTTYRFQPAIAGWYHVDATAHVSVGASATDLLIQARKNGTEAIRGTRDTFAPGVSAGVAVSGLVQLNGTTDYLDIGTYTSLVATLDAGFSRLSIFLAFPT